ncbi:AAA family ATPase [Fulvimonas soli]|uniref:Pilus assembly protein CpaE n=1 Tax=Fulvimonas soli TaxID=155197 RepID=A0A316HYM4_9GAMM|nr:fimbrial protein [Fulvimonas soli]PWK85850.1 pilus assembly protein CpaE [Fulvimonas soli]
MRATASIVSIGKRELGVDLWFYSPDERRAQSLAVRLRELAKVHWKDSRAFDPRPWARKPEAGHVVLLDYAADAAPLSSELAPRLIAMAPGAPLLGVGSTRADRAECVLAALRAGVHDFIDLDASDEEIGRLLRRVLQRPAGAATVRAARPRGQLVLLLGARPGVGTSTLAAHLGALASLPPSPAPALDEARTLLLDLGYPAGDAALYLGTAGDFHYADALRNAARLDATLVRTALPHYESRLAVLAQAPGTAAPADAPETPVLIDCLRDIFGLLLCDAGGTPCRQLPPDLLRAANEIWLVTDQNVASVVALDACLRELESLHARDPRLALVVSHHDAACGVDAGQLAQRFSLPLLAKLPERARALRASANQGQLLHQHAPRDPYVLALQPLLARLRNEPPAANAASRWKQLLMRIGEHRWKTP